MRWNWQQTDWPNFSWRPARLERVERQFLLDAGRFLGSVEHLPDADREVLVVEAMSNEALTTSAIEGEVLNRDSLQSSIRRQLGLASDHRRINPAEQGIGEVMVDLYRHFADPIDTAMLGNWHRMMMAGRPDLRDVGRYRTHPEPMQVVSGSLYDPRVHFEAPPSACVPEEMARFIAWFNDTAPDGKRPLPVVTRAGICHLYFESIHPFEDGNGRIGRVLAEKVIAQSLRQPALTALAATILVRRGEYYAALEAANKHNEVSAWLAWFAGVALEAQARTFAQIDFLIDKTKLLDRVGSELNPRQLTVLLRVLREGPSGFTGGLSAGNYVAIAKTSPATAGRDLAELVAVGALIRTGELRHTRYHLPFPLRPIPRITIGDDGSIQSPSA